MRRILAICVLPVAWLSLAMSGYAQDLEREYNFNIRAETLGEAVGEIVKKSGLNVFYPYELARQTGVNPVIGRYTASEAIQELFRNSKFSGGLTESGTIYISFSGDDNAKKPEDAMKSGKGRNKLLVSAATMVLGSGGAIAQDVASDDAQDRGRDPIDMIVVTATKRDQALHDVPMSISVISSYDIEKKGFVSMDDYLRVQPGVNYLEQGAGRKNPLIMRGIAADPQIEDGTVGVYFGDVPLTASSANGQGTDWFGSPDLKLIDIERVEVLRGPQGTLYGSGSLTGTVRIIPAAPNLNNFDTDVTIGYSNTAAEGGDNFFTKGMINIPLAEDRLALRAVAYHYDNSGYINNVGGDVARADAKVGFANALAVGASAVNIDNMGESTYTGGRFALEWRPTERFSVVLTQMSQDTEQLGLPEVELGLAEYQQARISPQTAVITNDTTDRLVSDVSISNASLTYDFGAVELSSSTSLMKSKSLLARDTTSSDFIGPARQSINSDIEVLAQEVRLTSSYSGPLQGLLGLYYEDIDWDNDGGGYWTGDPDLNPFAQGTDYDPYTFSGYNFADLTQEAIFGELSYDFLDNLSATFGVRAFRYDRRQVDYAQVPAFGVVSESDISGKEDGQTYKANVTYNPTEDSMLYALWSQGFRLGKTAPPLLPAPFCDQSSGPGTIISVVTGEVITHQQQLDSDTLDNYEIGWKFSALDNRASVNVAAYHIDWSGIPISIAGFSTDGGTTSCFARANLGQAQSDGLELETSYQLTDDVYAELGISYVDATLSQDVETLGSKGDRLPGTPKFSGNLSIQYDFAFANRPAFVRADYSYVGGFYNNLQESGAEAGDYHQLGMRAGLGLGNVELDLFVQNLTDSGGLTWVNSVIARDARAYRLRPRTVGLQIKWSYN